MLAVKERPPGRVTYPHSHGPPAPIPPRLCGLSRLRRLVSLSPDATVDQVCDDAADRIEAIAESATEPIPVLEGDEPKRRRGRPRKDEIREL